MPLQVPNLDDRRYKDLVEEALSLIPTYAPEWTNHNPSDPGITLVELFAWLADMDIYRLNRITDKQHRKFLKLLGVPRLMQAQPAFVDVSFSPNPDAEIGDEAPGLIPRGTIISAHDPLASDEVFFETAADLTVEGVLLKRILTYCVNRADAAAEGVFVDNTTVNENERAYFPVFGDDPEQGDEFYLGFATPITGPLTMYISLVDLPRTELDQVEVFPSARVRWQVHTEDGWIGCVVSDDTLHLSVSGQVTLTLPDTPMTPATVNGHTHCWVRCRVEDAAYETAPHVDRLQLDTVTAIQRTGLKTKTFSSTGLPDFSVQVDDVPIIGETLQVSVQGENWNHEGKGMVEDFDASKAGDKHFVADLASGRITFGNGMQGRVPPEGAAVRIMWKAGGGIRGNVAAGAVTRVHGPLANQVKVENQRSAVGGRNAESIDQAISRVKTDLTTPARAVTPADFEFHTLRTPGLKVARARAVPDYHPNRTGRVPGIMTVIVVPESSRPEPRPSTGFLKTVKRHLDAKRLLATELFVIGPHYVRISVSARVVIKPQYTTTTVKENVGRTLDAFLHPVHGGEDGAGWPFGRPVYRSEIYQLLKSVEGVNYVLTGSVVLTADGAAQPADTVIPLHGLVCPHVHDISAEE